VGNAGTRGGGRASDGDSAFECDGEGIDGTGGSSKAKCDDYAVGGERGCECDAVNKPVVCIDEARDALSELTLTPLARAVHAADVEKFMQILRTNISAPRNGVEAETSFFRDFAPFELLRRSVLPKLIEIKRNEREVRAWCAASSTGQEAYSVAMMLCEDFPELMDWDVKIIASDISGTACVYASSGRYRRMEVNRGLPARMLLKYFKRDGDEWQIIKKIRAMVEFRCLDLCAPLPVMSKFDLVLLRNVLLYFPQGDRGCVLADVHRVMHSHGVLLMGDGEQTEDSTDLFRVVFQAGSYYYRPLKGGEQGTASGGR